MWEYYVQYDLHEDGRRTEESHLRRLHDVRDMVTIPEIYPTHVRSREILDGPGRGDESRQGRGVLMREIDNQLAGRRGSHL
jgi:hypothetical protein